MKTFSLVMVLFLCAYSGTAQHSTAVKQSAALNDKAEKQDITYVKAIDVKTLDPSLPSQSLESWLQSGPPRVDLLRWESDETCDLKPDSDEDYPRCVRVAFKRGGQHGYFLVLIGTLKKGIIGPPQLYSGIGVFEEGFVNTGGAQRLSDLPHLLDQPAVTDGVNDLYQAIVKRHPVGIPKGEDKAAIWPFLSRHLIQKLETAQACQDDYYRLHPSADGSPKPAWLDSGIFVGESKRVLPLYALVTKKLLQGHAAYAVSVELIYVKVPDYVPDEASWEVVASVVQEDNRFVVDDVRLFDGLRAEGPSHLLTESFTGCDGTRWAGEQVGNEPHNALPPPHYTDWDSVNALRSAAWNEEVAFAKALDVHQLDASLPSQSLEDWLKPASFHASHIEWRGLQCNINEGEYGATRKPDGGLCAEVWFKRGNASARIKVAASGDHPPLATEAKASRGPG